MIIRRPLVTEKNTDLSQFNTYVFEVDRKATKPQIQKAIEKMFPVHVESVRTIVTHGKVKRVGMKAGRRPNLKKAYVTLRQGETIELFKGV